MKKLIFLDIETTGLDADRHEVWEVGAIERVPVINGDDVDKEHHWFLSVTHLETADPQALEIGGYYERHPDGDEFGLNSLKDVHHAGSFSRVFEMLTRGATLVGANVRFDEAFLAKYLKDHHRVPGWHYRLCDVEALAQGFLGEAYPLSLKSSANLLNIDSSAYESHTALDDAKLARDVYDRCQRRNQ